MSPLVAFMLGSALTGLVLLVVAWELWRWVTRPLTAAYLIRGALRSMSARHPSLVVRDVTGIDRVVPFASLEASVTRFVTSQGP